MESPVLLCLSILLACHARSVAAQTKTPAQLNCKLMVSAPLSFPLYATLNKLPQQLPAADSVLRLLYAHNRVRTVTVTGPETPFGPDTLEHFELDQRGNKIRIDQPHGGQTRLQRFDKQGHFVELVLLAVPSYPLSMRVLYAPRTLVNTSYVTVGSGEPVLWQQVQDFRKGDTASTEAVFKRVPGIETKGASRFVSRSYPTGRDTLRLEFIGYDAADQPIDYSAMYVIRHQYLVVENGSIDFGKLPASELLRLSRQQRGRYVPNTRNVYDQRGQLMQTTNTWETAPEQKKSDARFIAEGSILMTRDTPFAGMTTCYTRTPAGQVQREEATFHTRAGASVDSWLLRPVVTDFEYAPNGLLIRKTDNRSNGKPTAYDVKYTFY